MTKENIEEESIKQFINSIKDWYSYFLNKKKIFIIITILSVLIGYLYSYTKEILYTATLTFALEEKAPGADGIGSIATQFGFNLGVGDGGAFAGENVVELLKSRYIIEKTLLTEVKIDNNPNLLINRFIDTYDIDKNWYRNDNLKNLKFSKHNLNNLTLEHDSILGLVYLKIVKEMLDIKKVDKKLSIFIVNFISEDEIFCKLFTENLVRNVSNFYIETKTSKSRANIKLLEYRVDSVRKELDVAMYSKANFSDQNLGLVRQSASVPRIRQEVNIQMLSTMYGELIKNLEFSRLALMREEPLVQIIDIPKLPLKKQKTSAIKSIVVTCIILNFLAVIYLSIKKLIFDLLNRWSIKQ